MKRTGRKMKRRTTKKMTRRMIKKMKRKIPVTRIRKTLARPRTKVNQLINNNTLHIVGIVLNHIY